MGSFGLYVGFYRRAFLDQLCDGAIDQHFQHAAVLGPNGKPYRDWVVAVAHNRVVVRGSDLPEHNYCPVCGALRYVSRGGFFLYPAPPENIDIFNAGGGTLVVTEKVVERIHEHRWPKLTVTELGVAPKPLDGFGTLPLRRLPSNTNTSE